MLLAAGGLVSVAGAPAAEAAKKTGLQINGVRGTAGPTDADQSQRFIGSVRITEIRLLDETTRSVAVKGFLKGDVYTSSGSFVRHVPETAFPSTNAVLNASPRRAEEEPDGEPRIIPAAFEVQEAQAAVCPILVLDIGAIHLDLLGLVVDLAPISLDITAVPGAGNLLGNLLCAVANLLNGTGGGSLGGLLAQINQILQSILAIIGTL
jgi:hypothetical protein